MATVKVRDTYTFMMAQRSGTAFAVSAKFEHMHTWATIQEFHPWGDFLQQKCLFTCAPGDMYKNNSMIWIRPTLEPHKCPSAEEQINKYNEIVYNKKNEQTTAIHSNMAESHKCTV